MLFLYKFFYCYFIQGNHETYKNYLFVHKTLIIRILIFNFLLPAFLRLVCKKFRFYVYDPVHKWRNWSNCSFGSATTTFLLLYYTLVKSIELVTQLFSKHFLYEKLFTFSSWMRRYWFYVKNDFRNFHQILTFWDPLSQKKRFLRKCLSVCL